MQQAFVDVFGIVRVKNSGNLLVCCCYQWRPDEMFCVAVHDLPPAVQVLFSAEALGKRASRLYDEPITLGVQVNLEATSSDELVFKDWDGNVECPEPEDSDFVNGHCWVVTQQDEKNQLLAAYAFNRKQLAEFAVVNLKAHNDKHSVTMRLCQENVGPLATVKDLIPQ